MNGNHRFPVSTEALAFMQDQILFLEQFVQVAGPNTIIKDSTASVAGLVVVNGELLPLQPSTVERNFIQVVTTAASLDAGGLHFADIRTTRTAVYRAANQGNECYPIANFANMSTLAAITAQLASLSVGTVPVGSITMWAAATAPENWHLCNGDGLRMDLYPELYAVIGNTYGSPAPNWFFVPNLCGKFVVGLDPSDTDYNALKKEGGAKKVTLTEQQLPSHTHGKGTLNSTGCFPAVDKEQNPLYGGAFKRRSGYWQTYLKGSESGDRWGAIVDYDWAKGVPADAATDSTGGGQSHENRPPFITMNYIIKVR